jgi:hypothetical protein
MELKLGVLSKECFIHEMQERILRSDVVGVGSSRGHLCSFGKGRPRV